MGRISFIDNHGFSTYCGADILATIKVGDMPPYSFGGISDMTLSTHRPAYEVLAVGDNKARGFTRGPRVVAGQLVFIVDHAHMLYKIASYLKKSNYSKVISANKELKNMLVDMHDGHEDELPLFDIIVNLNNEEGFFSHMIVYGVQIVDSQLGFGINSPQSNIIYTYVAIDYKPVTPGNYTESTGSTVITKAEI